MMKALIVTTALAIALAASAQAGPAREQAVTMKKKLVSVPAGSAGQPTGFEVPGPAYYDRWAVQPRRSTAYGSQQSTRDPVRFYRDLDWAGGGGGE